MRIAITQPCQREDCAGRFTFYRTRTHRRHLVTTRHDFQGAYCTAGHAIVADDRQAAKRYWKARQAFIRSTLTPEHVSYLDSIPTRLLDAINRKDF